MLYRGFESQFEVRFQEYSLSSAELGAIEAEAAHIGSCWSEYRRVEPELDQHRVHPAQVGVIEARFSTDGRGRIESIVFAGDFIANSPGVEVLEQRLRGCRLEASAIDPIVADVFDGRENFILGIGPLDAISRLLGAGGPS